MTTILQTGNQSSVCQVTRCIVNITFDEHCRYMCVKAGLSSKLKNAAQRVRSSDVDDLCKTACSNMEVGVSGDVQREVDDALRTGKVVKVSAPSSSMKEQKKNDFEGLDELLGGSSGNYKPATTQTKTTTKPSSSALDDLDSLLDGPSKPKTTSYTPQKTTTSQPAKKQTSFDDLDDLLSNNAPTQPKQPTQSKQQAKFDDLDDLLSGMTPANNKPKQQTKTAVIDDLDDLLGDIGKPVQKQAQTKPKNDMDDIDSLLADMKPPSKGSKHNDDDIDSLLADLGSNKSKGGNKGKSSNEIDDLLADLM